MRRGCRAGAARRRSRARSRPATATTGITIMQMDAGLDTGPVVDMRRRADRARTRPPATLHDKLAATGAARDRRRRCRRLARDGALASTPQPAERRHLRREDRPRDAAHRLDAVDAVVLDRRVRAFDPAPGASRALGGEAVKIWRARRSRAASTPRPARSSRGGRRHRRRVRSGAGGRARCGCVEVQPAGGRRMDATRVRRRRAASRAARASRDGCTP